MAASGRADAARRVRSGRQIFRLVDGVVPAGRIEVEALLDAAGLPFPPVGQPGDRLAQRRQGLERADDDHRAVAHPCLD